MIMTTTMMMTKINQQCEIQCRTAFPLSFLSDSQSEFTYEELHYTYQGSLEEPSSKRTLPPVSNSTTILSTCRSADCWKRSTTSVKKSSILPTNHHREILKVSQDTVKKFLKIQWKSFSRYSEKVSQDTVKKFLKIQRKSFSRYSEKVSQDTVKKFLKIQWKSFSRYSEKVSKDMKEFLNMWKSF
jgi:hypothetical protein